MAYVSGVKGEPKSVSAASKLIQGKFLTFEIWIAYKSIMTMLSIVNLFPGK